ncbi:hypothetical protein A5784_29435 [Mycobacterium sp. 852013-50091_SCH5140682]|nr:hypothetical protein A5784_29435 [Mycobacterium sp. 852013-50091_SCH5140682]
MQLPPQELSAAAVAEPVVAAPPGLAAAAAVPVLIPIVVPPLVVPPVVAPLGAPGGGDGSGAPSDRHPSAQPTLKQVQPSVRTPPPAGHDHAVVPATYRVGYADYLRTAGTTELAALAVPGTVGIMALTGAGGIVGYRQARAGHTVRTNVARFVD